MEKQITITIILWVVFALISGILEGILFHKKKANIVWCGQDVHNWFTLLRAFVGILLCMFIFFSTKDMRAVITTGLSFIMIFSFFHDGMYYVTREFLKKGTYPKMRLDSSWNNQTSALFSFDPKERIALLFVGVCILFFQSFVC